MKIYGVIGWKNAGKTGLMERLVAEVRARGFSVSTIKHTHHAFDLDRPGKDSHRHREAGAREVLLASYKRWALLHEAGDGEEPSLATMLTKLEPVDLVLVEGYKRDAHAKIEVFREPTGHELIQPGDPTVRAVASDVPLDALPVPRFDLDNTVAIADFILAETGLSKSHAPALADACFVPKAAPGMATVAETQAMLRASLSPITGLERIAVAAADGRVLAEDAIAQRDNPPATNSAMDGYGFAFASLTEQPTLTLEPGRAAAGAPHRQAVAPGHAVKVLTGAVLPQGVDTVAMQEHVSINGGKVTLPDGLCIGDNTRAAGEDVKAGAVALPAATLVGPAEIGLLSALGLAEISVRRRLRVGVLSTGDELASPGSTQDPARTYDANRPMLLSLVRRWGHEVRDLGLVPDTREALRDALDCAGVDVLLTSGGASAGDADHVSALLAEEGQLAQWRVALKPGKPLVLGQWGRMPVFGLPGNPVSAFVTALLFAHPALSLLAGGDWREPKGFQVPAAFTLAKRAGRREFLRARLDETGRAELFRSDSSGMISSLAWADGFVELGETALDIRPGDPVRFVPLSEFGL